MLINRSNTVISISKTNRHLSFLNYIKYYLKPSMVAIAKKRILFVDDDEDILFCYHMVTESDEIIVYTAGNFNTALETIREKRIDVAILDYMLPDLRGDELAKRITQIDPNVKIFFISGYDIAVEAIMRLNIAVYGVFMKHVDPVVLQKIAGTEEYVSHDYQVATISLGNLYSNIHVT